MLFETRKPYVKCRTGQGKTLKLLLTTDAFDIGSDPGSDLHINAPEIASKHATIARMGENWVIRVQGLNRVFIAGELLSNRDRTLASGDIINIAEIVDVEFTDPEELKRKKKSEAASLEAEKAEKETTVPLHKNTKFYALAAVVWASVAYLALHKDVRDKPLQFSEIHDRTIDAAVEDLEICLAATAENFREDQLSAGFDLRSRYALLAKDRDNNSADSAVQDYQKLVQHWLLEGMRAEGRQDSRSAKAAYKRVRSLVPDLRCKAHRLASARLDDLAK